MNPRIKIDTTESGFKFKVDIRPDRRVRLCGRHKENGRANIPYYPQTSVILADALQAIENAFIF